MANSAPEFYLSDVGEGPSARIAYRLHAGVAPTVVFLCGFASDMSATKALSLERYCTGRGQAFLRFDYQGHGLSSGNFEDGDIEVWSRDAIELLSAVTNGPLVLIGSSMGAWVMLRAALALPQRVVGLLGIAPAPDFTIDLIEPSLSAEQRSAIERDGVLWLPSRYSDRPTPITQRLLDAGRRQRLLHGSIDLECPVRLVHGMNDLDVPWQTSLRLSESLRSKDVRICLVKDAGHRLSSERELSLIQRTLDELLRGVP
ncbi:MAG: alpha/beta fold hydrolase [Gammaproteobacteria bacterium]